MDGFLELFNLHSLKSGINLTHLFTPTMPLHLPFTVSVAVFIFTIVSERSIFYFGIFHFFSFNLRTCSFKVGAKTIGTFTLLVVVGIMQAKYLFSIYYDSILCSKMFPSLVNNKIINSTEKFYR